MTLKVGIQRIMHIGRLYNMGLFGKKKSEEDEDALIEKLTKSSEKPVRSENSGSGSSKTNLSAEVEKIGAQISALREVLQAQQERFERQSEEIGELRSALAERERQMREIDAKAAKITGLVEDVQPEKLMSEQKKAEAKIEAVKSKLESFEAMSNSIVEELKKIKGNVSAFRGLDEVIKLKNEIQTELMNVKKMEATMEKHADHVEAMFNTFESNFSTFEKMKDGIKYITEECDLVKKENEKNGIAIKDMPRKEEFYQAKKAVEDMLGEIKNERQICESRNAALESKISGAIEKIKMIESVSSSAKSESLENSKKLDDAICTIERTAKILSTRLN